MRLRQAKPGQAGPSQAGPSRAKPGWLQTDVFRVECADLGELTHLTVGHDDNGIGAGWFLDQVARHVCTLSQRGALRCNRVDLCCNR